MRVTHWLAGSLAGLTLVIGSVAPADAQPRYGRGGGWNHHHHRERGNGFGFGDAVGIAALLGAAAVVATSVSKNKANRGDAGRYDGPEDGSPDGPNDYYSNDNGPTDTYDDAYPSSTNETNLSDACALAARDQAQSQYGYAEIRYMNAPLPTSSGFNIDGELDTRTSWSSNDNRSRQFTCAMQNGQVANVYFRRDIMDR